jgi:outer membrane protein assembly factor BamB
MWELPVPAPSTPALATGTDYVYVGSSDGNLYQVDVTTGDQTTSPDVVTVVIGAGASAVGSPTLLHAAQPMAAVGTEEGAVYAVEFPFTADR